MSSFPAPSGRQPFDFKWRLPGGNLNKVFFCSSGSEGVEAAIKFARATTRRTDLICATRSFHGLTAGALSLMSGPFWRERFGPLLQDTVAVPFDDIPALEKALAPKHRAAFVVEPIQAEAGINIPRSSYLQEAEALCRNYGTLFVLDEVQTGMYRTGTFLAGHHFGVTPDIVILAKALSGGLVPVGAVLMTNQVYESVYSSLKHAIFHTSTFSENRLAFPYAQDWPLWMSWSANRSANELRFLARNCALVFATSLQTLRWSRKSAA